MRYLPETCISMGIFPSKWHGIGGRTVSKVIRHDLGILEKFAPEIVVIQLGTNDLSSLSAVETGSGLDDLSRLLHESYGVQRVCVCQTVFRSYAPLFNRQVKLLTKYVNPTQTGLFWSIGDKGGGGLLGLPLCISGTNNARVMKFTYNDHLRTKKPHTHF